MDKMWTLNFRLASRIDASVIFESNESLAMIVHNFCADKITTDDDEYDDFSASSVDWHVFLFCNQGHNDTTQVWAQRVGYSLLL